MKKIYDIGKIEIGKFVDRPNRFIAEIEIDNKVEKCHVHDSGRSEERRVGKEWRSRGSPYH